MVNLTTTERDIRFTPKAGTDLAIRRRIRSRRTLAGEPPGVPPSTRPSTRDVTNNSPVTGLGGFLGSIGGDIKGLAGQVLTSGLAKGAGRVASAVDKPISERLGVRIPDLPGPFDEIGNFVLEEGSRPSNLLFAAGGAPGLASKVPGILRPIVTRGGLKGAFAGEALVSGAARAGADLATRGTDIPGGPIVGGLAAGIGTALLLSRGRFQSVAEISRRNAAKFKKLLATAHADETGSFSFGSAADEALFERQQVIEFEDELRILNAAPEVAITDGRLIQGKFAKANNLVEDIRQDTSVMHRRSSTSRAVAEDDSSTREARDYLTTWVEGETEELRNIARGESVRERSAVLSMAVLKKLYEMGEPFRARFTNLPSDGIDFQNGTIRLLRGEKTYHYGNDSLTYFPGLKEPQTVQSYSTQRNGAGFFAANSGSSFNSADDTFVIERWVPVDDIIVNPVGISEAELLVLDRNKIPDDMYLAITGKKKSELGLLEIAGTTFESVLKDIPMTSADRVAVKDLVKLFQQDYDKQFTKIHNNLSISTDLDIQLLQDIQNELTLFRKALVDDVIPSSLTEGIPKNVFKGPAFEDPVFLQQSAELEKSLLEDQIADLEISLPKAVDELTSSVKDNQQNLIDTAKEKLMVIVKFIGGESGEASIEGVLGKKITDIAKSLRATTQSAIDNGIVNIPNIPSGTKRVLNAEATVAVVARKIETPSVHPTAVVQVTKTHDTIQEALDESLEALKEAMGTSVSDAGGSGIRPPKAPSGSGRGSEPPEGWTQAALDAARGGGDIFTQINTLLRTLWATLDGSWFGIQGLLNAVDDPILTAKSMRQAFDAMTDPTVLTDYLKAIDEDFLAKGITFDGEQITVDWLEKRGLQIAYNKGTEFSIAEDTFLGKIPGITQSNRLFSASGDFMRINLMMQMMEAHGLGQIDEMIAAINRSTGVSSGRLFGQPGNVLLFAPRFFQAQLEVIAKAATDWKGLEGDMARRQLLKLAGLGVAATVAINSVRGEDTVFDPTDSNFMKIRSVKGVDISLFGPWDSLIRGLVKTMQGDFGYFPRTKASPLISVAIDLARGKTFLGENSHDPKVLVKSLVMPFAWQNVSSEPAVGTALGFFGFKATPLTGNEILENNMERAGLDPEDPLERRQYLLEHPEDLPKSRTEDQEAAELVRNETDLKQELLETQVLDDSMTLSEFREARKIINREQRTRLNVILGSFDREPRNAQQQWIKTYYDLFDEAKDPITGELNGDTLDRLQAQWLNLYGPLALRYVSEFSLVGKGTVETEYLNALAKLETLGYFNLSRYRGMKSDLSEDQISDYRSKVQAARFADNRLAGMDFKLSVQVVLRELGLSSQEIRDVINSGSGAFANPEYTKFLNNNKELIAWFNPSARWSTLQVVAGR